MGRNSVIKVINDFIKKLSRDFTLQGVIMFGSQARGDANARSDVDLIIVSKDFKKLKSYERSARMYDYWDVLIPVDFICYTPDEFKKLRNRISLVSEALREGIKIH